MTPATQNELQDLPIVDSHHHFFDLDRVYYPWLTDRPEPDFLLGDYEAIKADYLPADYARDAAGLNIVKTVHVEAEADHDAPLAETRFLETLHTEHGKPDAIVGHAWFHTPDSEAVLEAQAASPLMRGIRSKPVTGRSPADSVAGRPGSLQNPAWRRGLGLLRRFGLSWDLRVPFWHLEEAAEVVGLYPDLPVVVEHTGLPWDRGEAGLAQWRRGMKALAAHENVWLKVSELGLRDRPWDFESNRRVVREALETFGFRRAMFGSNFPVARLRIGYAELVHDICRMIEDCSDAERRLLFHDNALRFYRLS